MTTGKKVKEALRGKFFESKNLGILTQGMAIRIFREKNGLSQNELSRLTGLNQSTISSLENDRIKLGLDRAKVLARALKVHPAVIAFPDWDAKTAA